MIGIEHYLTVAAALFVIGIFGLFLNRKNVIIILIVIGADAHHPERVGDGFGAALLLLKQCGFEHTSYFLERQRFDVPIHDALESLSEERAAVC